ncbi:MAG TPA: FemAB family XrtA/PEP-CTERM system-associated protein [Planctomycetota bacterium]|nr:FemAB family XrtA/PEP-CTERM system-associated protein [Planctomycetota bacterium]
MSLRVELLDLRYAREADRFVARHPLGSPFHETRWLDLVRATFRFETQTLVAWRGRDVAGVLPLALVTAPLTGRRLVSVPFGVYGGILAQEEEVLHALDEGGQVLARRASARFLELRWLGPGLTRHESFPLYETYRRALPPRVEDVLGLVPRKARAEVRKARDRHRLELIGGPALFDDFYRLYVHNKQSLGSPVFAPSYFRRLLDLFGPRALLHGLREPGGRLLSAVISLRAGDTLYPYYSGAAPDVDRLGANNAMYAALMEEAVRLGLRTFDFGRSRANSGPAAFKRHMGFEPTPLDYQFFFPHGGHPPQINPDNPRMVLPRRILASLPAWLARLVGPAVMRNVP